MKPMGGLILESPQRKSFYHENVFGAAPFLEEIKVLGRDTSGLPVISQGSVNSCVSCSVTWVRQWLDKEKPDLSWEWLAEISHTRKNGARPSQVLEPARKIGIVTDDVWKTELLTFEEKIEKALEHKISGYFYVRDLSKQGIYHALKTSPLLIGVQDWGNVGPHAMVAYDVTENGQNLKCKNWWKENEQDEAVVPFDKVVLAVAFASLPENMTKNDARMGFCRAMLDKGLFYLKRQGSGGKGFLALLGVVLGLTGAFLGWRSGLFGAGYTPPTAYESRTMSFITAAATTIPVASTLDRSGSQITMANISPSSTPRVFLMLEPGTQTQQEIIGCTGITATAFTGCLRGLPFQGGSLTEFAALAKAHNAGSKVIITNVGQFFTEYVSRVGNETLFGIKTFNDFPAVTSSAAVPTNASQLVTKTYADSLTIAGAAPSTTQGMQLDSDSTLYVLASTTASFDGGFLQFGTSTNNIGKLYWDIRTFLARATTWIGNMIFSGTVTFNNMVSVTAGLGTIYVPTPTDPGMAATKNYVDDSVSAFYATGTTMIAVSAGQAVAVTSSGYIVLADSGYTASTYKYLGIAAASAASGTTLTYIRPGGIISTSTALTPQKSYYLSTNGSWSTGLGTVPARIGFALDAHRLQLTKPYFFVRSTGTSNPILSGTQTITLGWTPSRVKVMGAGGGNPCIGKWSVDGSGTRSQYSIGVFLGGASYTSSTSACAWDEGATEYGVQVATTTNGFTLMPTGGPSAGGRTVTYTAEYDFDGVFLGLGI